MYWIWIAVVLIPLMISGSIPLTRRGVWAIVALCLTSVLALYVGLPYFVPRVAP